MTPVSQFRSTRDKAFVTQSSAACLLCLLEGAARLMCNSDQNTTESLGKQESPEPDIHFILCLLSISLTSESFNAIQIKRKTWHRIAVLLPLLFNYTTGSDQIKPVVGVFLSDIETNITRSFLVSQSDMGCEGGPSLQGRLSIIRAVAQFPMT